MPPPPSSISFPPRLNLLHLPFTPSLFRLPSSAPLLHHHHHLRLLPLSSLSSSSPSPSNPSSLHIPHHAAALHTSHLSPPPPPPPPLTPIISSDTKRNEFRLFRRSFLLQDLLMVGQACLTICLTILAAFTFSWQRLGLASFLSVMTGLGITLSYHRNLSHRSFKLPKWMEYFWAYCGVQAMQGDPLWWVSVHRYHHQHTDGPNDPHSRTQGFFHSHLGWLFNQRPLYEKISIFNNVADMVDDPFYKFLNRTYPLHPALMAIALYAVGGIPYVIWGWGFRCFWIYNCTFLVNSAAHTWGYKTWKTHDTSKNNWLVAILLFGEGWHNNHHAFPRSARHGLEWWEFDVTWVVVKALEAMGVATEVKLPTKQQMQSLAMS